MKNWHASFLSHITSGSTSLCTFWRVTRYDGEVFGWVENTAPIIFAGVTYYAGTGFSVSSTQKTDTLAVQTIDITAFLDVTTEQQILAGVWNGARIKVFEANYLNMPLTFDESRLHVMEDGTLGNIVLHNNIFQAEIRGKTAALDATQIGRQYMTLCPLIFGDAICSAGGLNIADFTFAGTVTSVGDNPRLTFSASALNRKNGAFNQGTITFTSGANAGMPPMDIRSWREKRFTMQRPLPYAVAIGDDFDAVLGDDKTLATCRDVFDNIGQHSGYPYLPGIDRLIQNKATAKKRPIPPPAPDDNPFPNPDPDGDGDGNGE